MRVCSLVMSFLFRVSYPLAVIVLPVALCWMYLRHAPAAAFVGIVAFWIFAMLLRDFSASVLRMRELAYLRCDYQRMRERLFPEEVEAERQARDLADWENNGAEA